MVRYSITLRAGGADVTMESESREELLKRLDDLVALARSVAERVGGQPAAPVPQTAAPVVKTRRRRGKSEAVEVLRHIEEKLIPSGFFREARSTADTRAKLKELVGVLFQSRKVSQALGILYDKGVLRRAGPKGNYRYYMAS